MISYNFNCILIHFRIYKREPTREFSRNHDSSRLKSWLGTR